MNVMCCAALPGSPVSPPAARAGAAGAGSAEAEFQDVSVCTSVEIMNKRISTEC